MIRIEDDYCHAERRLHDARLDLEAQQQAWKRAEQVREEIRKEIQSLRAKAEYYRQLSEQATQQADNLQRMANL